MPQGKPHSRLLEFALIFLVVYLATQYGMRMFFPDTYGPGADLRGIHLEAVDRTVKGGHHPVLRILNKTEGEIRFTDRCPMPPVRVLYRASAGGVFEQDGERSTQETVLPCAPVTALPPGETVTVDLAPWKYSLFDAFGYYQLVLPIEGQPPEGSVLTAEIQISPAGPITQVFRSFITKPFLNFLIFVASVLPDHDLGIAVIVLTVLVKLLLFFPTQHAMEGQRKMQAVQPLVDALREKYKDDAKKMQVEMMRIWKENKVNPFQSCLPTLIQLPILIGLFFVIRDGAVLELSRHLIYGFYSDLPWSFDTNFFGLDLTSPSMYLMPPLLVLLQFGQLKMSFAIAKKKTGKSGEKEKRPASQQEIQQKVMLYGLPIMIGFFALQFPAAVSLYWAVSTVFGIAQQLYVNRKIGS